MFKVPQKLDFSINIVLHEFEDLSEDKILPKPRKVPQQLDDGSSGHV